MSSGMGHGFREVLIDQPFAGKWMEVDMNLGGGHSTFQGTKFSDFAGGFSYKNGSNGKPVTQNRCIYWRTVNDTLELTEMSMDFNLVDSQVRYIFQGSPIVGPITIQETEPSVVILVATVTSVNRFIFTHPKRLPENTQMEKNNKPSIFHQICNKPQMIFRSFNLYEHAINIPVPLSAACFYVQRGTSFNQNLQQISTTSPGECFFAFSFDSGSINLYKINREDTLHLYDLKSSNMFTRMFAGLSSSIMRTPTTAVDAVIGLNFCATKGDRDKSLQLVTLSLNGHLSLWFCPNLDNFNQWNSFHCGIVDNRFAVDNYTDSCMLLRKSDEHTTNELPIFAIYLPGEGFRVYKMQKNATSSVPGQMKFSLVFAQRVDFPFRELMDFSVTSEYLFTLVNNPEEEMEWEIQSYKFDTTGNNCSAPCFQPIVLEPLPLSDVTQSVASLDAKGFYVDLIFDKSSFSSQTISKALTMFRKEEDDMIKDKDWESLRTTAMNMIDREIELERSNTEFDLSDEEYTEISHKYWLMFYNSCVEYHIHTVKPLGLFYETNMQMVCVVKKSRISFLRPMDFLETMYFLPECLELSDVTDAEEVDEERYTWLCIVKYLDVVKCLENELAENHISKINKRLRENVSQVEEVCKEITHFIITTDQNAFEMDDPQLVQIYGERFKDLGDDLEMSMKKTLDMISTWEGEGNPLNSMDIDDYQVYDCYMSSRVGAHLTFKILKQMMQHRFMIARDSMIIQCMIVAFFSQSENKEWEDVQMSVAWVDNEDAKNACISYFALLELSEDSMEQIPPFIKERGQKVANILKLLPSDGLETVDPLWPTKIMEGFCLSNLGNLSIRSVVNQGKVLSVLAHVEAAGRCIWTNNLNIANRPFEDFLIITCQYTIFLKYSTYMMTYFSPVQLAMKHFYLGLAHICLYNMDQGLKHFLSINFRDALQDEYFCLKVLQVLPIASEDEMGPRVISLFNSFYVRIISIFQKLDYIPGVLQMAEEGLKVAETDEEAIKMCTLAFKCALQLDDYDAAYQFILSMPYKGRESTEKLATLRMFVGKLLRKGELDTLIALNLNEAFNQYTTVREQVEEILFAQASLSDPLKEDGVYQMLYAYYLCKGDFHKAAATMYYRAMRLGEKAMGKDAVKAQKECYVDVMTCLSLIEDEECRYTIKSTGVLKSLAPAMHDGEHVRQSVSAERQMILVNYPDIQKELMVLCKLSKIENDKPVKPLDFERRAEKTVEMLYLSHYYDDAIELATLWEIDPTMTISYFTDVCRNLVYNIMPDNGDPSQYLNKNDMSELPSSDTAYADIAFRLLQSYIIKLEKRFDSKLHQAVSLKLLEANIELPQWLVDSYKKRNAAQYLRCLIKHQQFEKATDLSLRIIDATLGRTNADEFDFTISKISSYECALPSIPIKDIEVLANMMAERKDKNRGLIELLDTLQKRAALFCARVNDSMSERRRMFGTQPQFDRDIKQIPI